MLKNIKDNKAAFVTIVLEILIVELTISFMIMDATLNVHRNVLQVRYADN